MGRSSLGSLRTKLTLLFVALGTVPVVAIGGSAYGYSRSELTERTGQFFEAAAADAGVMVSRTLFERYGDAQAFAHNPALRGEPAATTEAANFYVQSYGFYDLLIVADAEGTIVAVSTVDPTGKPVQSTALIGQSVRGQEWFEQSIGGSVARGTSYSHDIVEDPLTSEAYGKTMHTVNFSAPIYDEQGTIVRVLSNRVSRERLLVPIVAKQREMLQAAGFKSIETQVLDRRGLVLDDYDSKAIMSLNLVDKGLDAARRSVEGGDGYTIEEHKRTHVDMMNGYAPVPGEGSFRGFGWSVLVRAEAADAFAAATRLRDFVVVGGAVLVALITAVAWVFARSISAPLERVVHILERFGGGDLTVRAHFETNDEIGRMAAALDGCIERLSESLASIRRSSESVGGASRELAAVSAQLGSNASQTASQANMVSAASEEVSSSFRNVASGVGELQTSIQQIATQTTKASSVAEAALRAAHHTNKTVNKLGDSSVEIGNVVKIISAIAEQTNLLALNATIEAARAGEAGKGFAVVANEVKGLAGATARATDDIARKIETIQSDVREAVRAIAEIGAVVEEIHGIQTSIVGAVEEQTASTGEMSRSLSEVGVGSDDIARNISGVAEGATCTTQGADAVRSASSHLDEITRELEKLVSAFKLAS